MKTVGSTNWYDRIGEGYNNLRQPNWKLLLQAPLTPTQLLVTFLLGVPKKLSNSLDNQFLAISGFLIAIWYFINQLVIPRVLLPSGRLPDLSRFMQISLQDHSNFFSTESLAVLNYLVLSSASIA